MFLKLASFPGDKALVRMGCKKPRLGLNVETPREIFSSILPDRTRQSPVLESQPRQGRNYPGFSNRLLPLD